jgi:wyosine [tRNA(Phe)-imidazoG37] synthetase (radical SAM superfamily)
VDHDRYAEGARYVYPVVSRRAGGVSVGVNLNPNDACNWRCVYCQVPGLTSGNGPVLELPRLAGELKALLGSIVHGDFLETRVPQGARRLNDVAFSGNGEPTSSPQFGEAVELVGEVLSELGLLGKIRVVLITNGSLVLRPAVQAGLARMKRLNGEVWFKLDRVGEAATRAVNSVAVTPEKQLERLRAAATACPTWIQSCFFAEDGAPPSAADVEAYLELLKTAQSRAIPLQGVLLYGLARPSEQPEAPRLRALPASWMQALGARIEALGLSVRVTP